MHNRFPDGKLNADDEGELTTAVGVENGCVKIDFGTPVAWVAFPPQQAADLASIILKHARTAAAARGESVTFTINARAMPTTDGTPPPKEPT